MGLSYFIFTLIHTFTVLYCNHCKKMLCVAMSFCCEIHYRRYHLTSFFSQYNSVMWLLLSMLCSHLLSFTKKGMYFKRRCTLRAINTHVGFFSLSRNFFHFAEMFLKATIFLE